MHLIGELSQNRWLNAHGYLNSSLEFPTVNAASTDPAEAMNMRRG